MKPYEDQNCKCYEIEEEMEKWWNVNRAKFCQVWDERSDTLIDNDIELGRDDLGCHCPTCGRFICGECI